jgi:hypothetical protein
MCNIYHQFYVVCTQALETFVTASADDVGQSNTTDHNTASPLAGLGYGLPISRCYARHFGELVAEPMCDAMLACVMFLRWCCVGYNAVCYVMYV